MFGGEFTSPGGKQFYHYGDLWRFDVKEGVWDELKTRGGPSPRSGTQEAEGQDIALSSGSTT